MIGKVLGERWKALTPAQREPYEAKARADKERYDAEIAKYAALVSILSSRQFRMV